MKDKLTFSASLLLALFSALAPTAEASTRWYVNGSHGRDSNNCKSPQTPCGSIGHAISLASPGDTIMVAAATYYLRGSKPSLPRTRPPGFVTAEYGRSNFSFALAPEEQTNEN
jgi:hypothetical protein